MLKYNHNEEDLYLACGLDKGKAISTFEKALRALLEGRRDILDEMLKEEENVAAIWVVGCVVMSGEGKGKYIPAVLSACYDAETVRGMGKFSKAIEGIAKYGDNEATINFLGMAGIGEDVLLSALRGAFELSGEG